MNYNKEYHSNGIVQFDAAKELIQLLPDKVDRLLDVGCGSGKVSHLIQEHSEPKTMVAIDASAEMLEQAHRLYPDSRIQFEHADIRHYTTATGFDVITSNSSFQWYQDYDVALLAIRSALNVHGTFALQTPYKQEWCPLVSELMTEFFRDYYPQLGQCFRMPCMHLESAEQYREMFESRGFRVLSIKPREFVYSFAGEEFKKFFMSGAYKVYTLAQSYTLPIPSAFTRDLESFIEEIANSNSRFDVSIFRLLACFGRA
ncbi:methyltransferase domain-containing protein [Vibrio sp. Isolate24]|uniref:class I SAM-dependent methyltransferase n=1 Tax=Vibrio sp. Isolate24 TaxID=2908534 RepID=UPI001EFE9DA8|nr:methyltransferase domain-containing protein [Vibrio sp. Isolate24]MCG9677919.1 class I SAM-dependent methyltransferase [Vibrio sp. Isolate24]